jgi:transglutaminase-like putative cysteine protease
MTLRMLLALGLAALPVAAHGFDPWTEKALYEVEYRADLSVLPGGPWRVWLPAPSRNSVQRVLAMQVEAPVPHRITEDALGNRYLYLEGDGPLPDGAGLVARFRVERSPSNGVAPASVEPGGPDDPDRHLRAVRRVPLDGLIAKIAVQEGRGLQSDSEKIRAYYDYVVRTMTYSKRGVGWGQGDAIWACTSKYGNCTDFHSLFIGMARSQGIPARFVIGFPIPPTKAAGEVPGYHCWAEAFDEERGWIPFDASEAKKSGRTEAYFGALPSDRVEFNTGRDLVLEPPQEGDPLNFFVYPYGEVRGKPVAKVPFRFRFERVDPTVAASFEGGTTATKPQ